jgi:fatty acid desaturase
MSNETYTIIGVIIFVLWFGFIALGERRPQDGEDWVGVFFTAAIIAGLSAIWPATVFFVLIYLLVLILIWIREQSAKWWSI